MVALTLHLCAAQLDRPLGEYPSIVIDAAAMETIPRLLQRAGVDQFHTFQLVTDSLRANVKPQIHEDQCFGVAINLGGVSSDGRFRYMGPETTLADLQRACDVGVFDGDPLSWIIHLDSAAAGGWAPDGLYEVAAWLLNQGGAAGVGFVVGAGLAKVPQLRYLTIRNDWRHSGYTGPRLGRMLVKQAQWDEITLAKLIGLEEAEARCVLQQAGYGRSPNGLWRPQSEPEAITRRAQLDALIRDAENDTP